MYILLHRLYNTPDAKNHTPTQYNKTKPTQNNRQPNPHKTTANQTHQHKLTANQHEPTTTIHLRTITPPPLYPTPNVNKTLLTIHQSSDNKVFRVKYL